MNGLRRVKTTYGTRGRSCGTNVENGTVGLLGHGVMHRKMAKGPDRTGPDRPVTPGGPRDLPIVLCGTASRYSSLAHGCQRYSVVGGDRSSQAKSAFSADTCAQRNAGRIMRWCYTVAFEPVCSWHVGCPMAHPSRCYTIAAMFCQKAHQEVET